MHDTALYYPWINFPDENWLKLTALFWERILRIRPAYVTDDRFGATAVDVVRTLEEADLVQSIEPGLSAVLMATWVAKTIKDHAGELRVRYGMSRRIPRETNDPGMTYIHADKMSHRLIETLVENGLALWGPDGWVVTHPDFARAYMSALAGHVGRETASSPITDDPLSHVAASGWAPGQLAETLLGVAPETQMREPSAGAPALAFVAFRSVVPTGLEQLDVDRLVKLRLDYGAELGRFRDSLAAIVAQAGLAAATHPEVYERQIADLYRTRIKPEADQLTHDLRLLKIRTVESILSIKTTLPPSVALLLAGGRQLDPSTATATGVAVGVFQLRQAMAEQAQLDLAQSPAAYLLRLQHAADAQARPLVASIRSSARRMLLGV